jgi:hypothetical protein
MRRLWQTDANGLQRAVRRTTMKSRIVCLAPGRVAPGMTLATAVIGRDGNTLLAAGTALDSEMLERLIRRGIETISVLVADTRDPETIAMEVRAAETRVDVIFRGTGSPARQALHAAILDFRREHTA